MQNIASPSAAQWSNVALAGTKWSDVPEEHRGRWSLVMLRAALHQAARIADVQRTPTAAAIARALRAAGDALVEA